MSTFTVQVTVHAETDPDKLVDNAQANNDRLLVENGKAMRAILVAMQAETESSRRVALQSQHLTEEMKKILQATQAETETGRRVAIESQKLAEEMKKDSVAMKTVMIHCS